MKDLGAICVYCGSTPGADPVYAEAAAGLGRLLAGRDIDVVYGGGHVGLMGIVADAALAAGGRVHGVITRGLLEREIAHAGLTSLEITETMHERKMAMADRSDAFITLPGGFGTLDELFEVLTWTQLGIHDKACGVLDVAGFFDPLRVLLDHATEAGFVNPTHRDIVLIDRDPEVLLERLAAWEPVVVEKWVDRRQR